MILRSIGVTPLKWGKRESCYGLAGVEDLLLASDADTICLFRTSRESRELSQRARGSAQFSRREKKPRRVTTLYLPRERLCSAMPAEARNRQVSRRDVRRGET